MIIDNDKFVALLAENSGIEKEKVESYLEELIVEIKAAFDEDEGYEIDGFGIFSKLGANVFFIPSEELETEINYKYVGMEPIELPGSATEETPAETMSDEDENPLQGLLDGEGFDEEEDPFAELLDDTDTEEESEEPISGESAQLDDEDIEAMVEEEIQHEETEESQDKEGSENIDTPIEGSEDLEEETLNDELEEDVEETPGPDKWGIDAHKEDDQEDAFAGLIGKDIAESSDLLDEEDVFSEEGEEKKDFSEDDEEEIDFSALEDDGKESDDFDDPFMELEEEQEEGEEDFVPVVTNVSSEKTTTTEEETKEEDSEVGIKSKTPSLKKPRKEKKSSPVFLYMILALVVLGGSGYLLAYFGIVNIKGITPNNTQVAQANTQVNQPQQAEPQTVLSEESANDPAEDEGNVESSADNPAENTGGDTEIDIPEEENTTNNDEAPLVADEEPRDAEEIISPVNIQANGEVYGLMGTATEAGNNGYTIVLYTLSRKAGADKQFEVLSKDGYRVIIKENPSEKYGVLYRVSIGQFRSLADAAIAAEEVDSKTLGNYIITKI
ncbi:MAG: SPOR domain-containing protein [Balneola sp.]